MASACFSLMAWSDIGQISVRHCAERKPQPVSMVASPKRHNSKAVMPLFAAYIEKRMVRLKVRNVRSDECLQCFLIHSTVTFDLPSFPHNTLSGLNMVMMKPMTMVMKGSGRVEPRFFGRETHGRLYTISGHKPVVGMFDLGRCIYVGQESARNDGIHDRKLLKRVCADKVISDFSITVYDLLWKRLESEVTNVPFGGKRHFVEDSVEFHKTNTDGRPISTWIAGLNFL